MIGEVTQKSLGPERVSIKADVEGREITGYAATFGNLDGVGDVIHPGAFTKTLRERVPQGLVKYFGFHRTMIGVLKHAEEDGIGLLTVGRISRTRDGDDVLELAKDGALTHMSIRYKTVREDKSKLADGRTANNLRELMLMEVGPVDFPANEAATIVSVKSMLRKDLWPLLSLLDAGSRAEAAEEEMQRLLTGGARVTDEEARRVLAMTHAMMIEGSDLRGQLESLLGGGTPEDAGESATSEPDDAEKQLAALVGAMRAWTDFNRRGAQA